MSIQAVTTSIDLVSTLVGALSRVGPGLGDLLRLQTEMLVEISEQNAVIDKKLDLLSEQIDTLAGIVRDLPNSVVKNALKIRGLSYADTFTEYVQTLQNDMQALQNNTIDRPGALVRFQEAIEPNLLVPLRKTRSELMEFTSSVAPIVASLLKIELEAMAMADYRYARLQPALARYQEWFVNVSIPHAKERIATIRTARKQAEQTISPGKRVECKTILVQARHWAIYRLRHTQFTYGHRFARWSIDELEPKLSEIDRHLMDDDKNVILVKEITSVSSSEKVVPTDGPVASLPNCDPSGYLDPDKEIREELAVNLRSDYLALVATAGFLSVSEAADGMIGDVLNSYPRD